jgi:hypothetical protein
MGDGVLSKDIAPILAGWEPNDEEPPVRVISGLDGRDKIQMRIELGLLQMELNGRPDGSRPFGSESLLDYHEARRAAGDRASFRLDSEECAELMREGIQYYHRYLALFHLERFDLVARDTSRNLRLFAFVQEHAARARDRLLFDQYRPYVLMMNARALALQALRRGDTPTALKSLDQGIHAIRAFLREYAQEDEEACRELTFLRRFRRQVKKDIKAGPLERLEEQLGLAIAREDYEEAARIRDQMQRLRAGVAASSAQSAPQDSGGRVIPGEGP